MNCNNLSKNKAIAVWKASELRRRWLRESLSGLERRKKYSAAFNETPFIKGQTWENVGGSYIHDNFRGFLTNGTYIIYVGDDWQGWWKHRYRFPMKRNEDPFDLYPNTWSSFGTHWVAPDLSEEGRELLENYNAFGVLNLIDVTDQICKDKAPFMNWIDENPLSSSK